VLILAACTSTDPVASYVEDLQAIMERLTDESSAALPPGTTPTHDAVAGVVAARRAALAALETTEPPADLAPEHLALVVVFTDFVEAATEFLDETASLDPNEFREALAASTDIDTLAGRVSAACDAIRSRARTLGHSASLEC